MPAWHLQYQEVSLENKHGILGKGLLEGARVTAFGTKSFVEARRLALPDVCADRAETS